VPALNVRSVRLHKFDSLYGFMPYSISLLAIGAATFDELLTHLGIALQYCHSALLRLFFFWELGSFPCQLLTGGSLVLLNDSLCDLRRSRVSRSFRRTAVAFRKNQALAE
jgi:hypothetical protein